LERKDEDGQTPVYGAVKEGCFRIVQFLADKVNLKEVDKDGNNLVHIAAKYDQRKIINFLAEQNVDLEKKNKWGSTPVIYAAQNGWRTVEIGNIIQNEIEKRKKSTLITRKELPHENTGTENR
jgi:ankyrin repeat protein